LNGDEVHVWRAALNVEASRVKSSWHLLSTDERVRADRFRFPKDRDHFIVAHGLLRAIISRYLDAAPDELRFFYGRYGKPALGDESGRDSLRFNLSHSRALAVYALSRGRDVGVDVEYIRPEMADEKIAEHFFSPREVAVLRSLPIESQPEAFFNCWTRKEAYVKATGKGLTLRLDQFDVSLIPGTPAALLRTVGNRRETSRWSLQELLPGPGYVGALAVEGHNWQLRCWQ
jgi:4'-phosphopantetheinyl transferase